MNFPYGSCEDKDCVNNFKKHLIFGTNFDANKDKLKYIRELPSKLSKSMMDNLIGLDFPNDVMYHILSIFIKLQIPNKEDTVLHCDNKGCHGLYTSTLYQQSGDFCAQCGNCICLNCCIPVDQFTTVCSNNCLLEYIDGKI